MAASLPQNLTSGVTCQESKGVVATVGSVQRALLKDVCFAEAHAHETEVATASHCRLNKAKVRRLCKHILMCCLLPNAARSLVGESINDEL